MRWTTNRIVRGVVGIGLGGLALGAAGAEVAKPAAATTTGPVTKPAPATAPVVPTLTPEQQAKLDAAAEAEAEAEALRDLDEQSARHDPGARLRVDNRSQQATAP